MIACLVDCYIYQLYFRKFSIHHPGVTIIVVRASRSLVCQLFLSAAAALQFGAPRMDIASVDIASIHINRPTRLIAYIFIHDLWRYLVWCHSCYITSPSQPTNLNNSDVRVPEEFTSFCVGSNPPHIISMQYSSQGASFKSKQKSFL